MKFEYMRPGKFIVKQVVTCLMIAACCALVARPGDAQSTDSGAANSSKNHTTRDPDNTRKGAKDPDAVSPDKKSQGQQKARRVWDNEEIQKIQGGINVVGSSSRSTTGGPHPDTAPDRASAKKPALTNRPPGPRFSATTIDGSQYTNASVLGKMVLVQVWTTWCPRCQADQQAVDNITRAYSGRLVVLAVNDGEPKATVKRYLEANPRSCEVVLGQDTDLGRQLGTSGYPHYVLIDRDGNVAGSITGQAGESRLRALLNRAGIDME